MTSNAANHVQSPRLAKSRRGNALVLTMLVTTGALSLISLASDRMLADSLLSKLDFDRQRAGFVAETVASLIEAKLASRAAERPQDMSRNLEQDPSLWWNLEGLSYTDENDAYIKAERALWVNGCAVRWRVEPVKIVSKSLNNQGQVSGADFTVNTETDPILAARRTTLATAAQGGNTLMTQDPGFYHFRIVAEAFALKSPRDPAATPPWKQANQHTCKMQAQRIVQIQLINLFRYVIFYAAPGQTGDIEFHPGPDLDILGSVHSNGAIYLGGGGRDYADEDYHTSATNGGVIRIGPDKDGNPVGITGVNGIFRMRKAGNVFFSAKNEGAISAALQVANPYLVPFPLEKTTSNIEMAGKFDLNGDSYNERIKLNNVDFGCDNDSRSALKDRNDPTKHVLDSLVTDQANRQARRIDTLASIPQLGGYPFEAQQIADVNSRLYIRNTGTPALPNFNGSFTINNGLFDSTPAYITPGGAVSTVAAGNLPLYATDLPLFQLKDPVTARWVRDVWPNQPTAINSAVLSPAATWPDISGVAGIPVTPALVSHTYLPMATATSRPAHGYYCQQSLYGQTLLTSTTGLTIRERGAQNPAFTWTKLDLTSATVPTNKPVTSEVGTVYADFVEFGRAYVAWLKSNYVVYLGRDAANEPLDITRHFFEFNSAAALSFDDLVASEDEFVNRRETAWLDRKNYFSSAAVAGTYRMNVLTLHVDKIQNFLSSVLWSTLDSTAPVNTELANTRFNGLIYVHRTPRLSQVPNFIGWNHPLMPLGYHPIADRTRIPPSTVSNGPLAAARYPELGLIGIFAGAVQVGDPNSFTMYPSNKAVRISRGSTIGWGGVQESGRAQGLTIATPNQCYLQGDYNISPDSTGKTPPCGVYADGVTVLSNAWADTGMVYDTAVDLPKAAPATTYIVSLVINNAPTDTENVFDEGSGGVHNAVRYLEDWGDCQYNFTGSLVVLNRMRYSRGNLGANNGPYYSPPKRNFTFNSDLLTKPGQPPFSPWGTSVTRVVSMLNVLNN